MTGSYGQVGVEEEPPRGPEGSPGPPGMCQPKGQAGEGTDFLAREPKGVVRNQPLCFQDTQVGQGLPGQKATSHLYGTMKATPQPKPQNQDCLGKEDTHQAG